MHVSNVLQVYVCLSKGPILQKSYTIVVPLKEYYHWLIYRILDLLEYIYMY